MTFDAQLDAMSSPPPEQPRPRARSRGRDPYVNIAGFIPEELRQRVQMVAAERGVPISAVVRKALEQHLRRTP